LDERLREAADNLDADCRSPDAPPSNSWVSYGYLRNPQRLWGPSATVLASITAACVAVAFGIYQAKIAKRQARIANDKLALDLFQRRIEALTKLRAPIGDIVRSGGSSFQIERDLIEAIEAARFLFGAEIKEYLDGLYDTLISLDAANKDLEDRTLPQQQRETTAKARTKHFQEIVSFYKKIDQLFGPYLLVGHIKFDNGVHQAK
jgi:hypothetical protein